MKSVFFATLLALTTLYLGYHWNQDRNQLQSTMTSLLSEDHRYKKTLSIQVARHGERSPKPYFDLVNGPNFQVGFKDLTETGAKTCYELGQQVARSAGLAFGDSYDSSEVYVLSTFKKRASASARAQMMGLYDKPFAWPLPADNWFKMAEPAAEDDYILRADSATCPRVNQIESALENDPNTRALYARVDKWLEQRFFPRLRELTGMPDADTASMYAVVDYIDWANRNGLDLKMELTEEDWRYIRVADEAGNYDDLAAQPDQKQMGAWELQQLYNEASLILRGRLAMRDAPVLTRYFPQAREALSMPKLILFSGHASNVTPLLELFNHHVLPNPAPASSVWVNFFECESCEGEERYKLEVLFCNEPRDLSECELLNPTASEMSHKVD